MQLILVIYQQIEFQQMLVVSPWRILSVRVRTTIKRR